MIKYLQRSVLTLLFIVSNAVVNAQDFTVDGKLLHNWGY